METISTGTASPTIDQVYHITAESLRESIEQYGLAPNPERPSINMDRLVDGQRPPKIVDQGISRVGAVFAHPDRRVLYLLDAMGRDTAGDQPALVGIDVDPETSLVYDAQSIDDAYLMLCVTEGDIEAALPSARSYWTNVVSLADFRRFYKLKKRDFSTSHRRVKAAPASMPASFSEPEVLLPGTVPPKKIHWLGAKALRAY